ncbi:hypothetical protein Nhal_2946 [Nitrosococcus halophilus Nc 4]|uniref:Uncharacterized protein n=1 Tax=Nitrosococcus halophilus (strain Nc4) TaxID=472759 RepID=D5BYL9_NITHN|nr:hypothetical protein [Nitrosococcus halophilus]ADE16007.1 hypothetical protein Nhal_2946 [Nitrosococcus halophilus Nc 4]
MEVVTLEDTIMVIITVPIMAITTVPVIVMVSVFIIGTGITLVAITVLDTIINFPHRRRQ